MGNKILAMQITLSNRFYQSNMNTKVHVIVNHMHRSQFGNLKSEFRKLSKQ